MGKKNKIISASVAAMIVATAFFVAYNVSHNIYADAGSDQIVDTNMNVQFNGSDSRGENLNYTWYFRDGNIGYEIMPVHSFTHEGIYEVGLSVRDRSGHTDSDRVKITVQNEYPETHADVDKRVYEDEQVEFDASGTIDTPLDMSTLNYSWDLGDGSSAYGMYVTHTYTKAGKYSVVLDVTDNDSAIGRDIMIVYVENLPPTANAGPDQTVNEDQVVTFDSSTSSDSSSDSSTLVYSWNFGDDSKGNGINPTHVYTKAGTYMVTLTVTDDDGAKVTDIMIVTVNNVPPTADAGSDQVKNEDQIVFFSGIGQDTQSDEPLLSYLWDFDDGSAGFGRNPTHIYQDEGIYSVELTVVDDNGDIDHDTILVTIDNLAPLVDAGPDIEVNEDVLVQFRGYAYDTASDEQSLSFSWDFGDGNTESGQNPTHIYTDQGTYIVTLTVTDDDSVIGTDSLMVTVKNMPPIVIATYTSLYPIILAGDVLTFNAKATDSTSDQSTLTYSWDFGDGTTSSGVTVTHAYAMEGIYEVTLTVTDDDGASVEDIIFVIVERHTFEMEITPLVKIMPGEEAEYIITLRNTGTINDAFDLLLTTSIDDSWIDFVEKHIFVEAKSFENVNLKIIPPEDFPLDFDVTLGFEIISTCVHQNTDLSNAPLIDTVSEDVTVIATYESRLRWAQAEVENLITDFSGGNSVDATLLKAVEEISEALFFASTKESPEFDYVMSFEHVKEGIHNLEMVKDSVTTDFIVNLLLIAVNDCVEDTINIAEIQAGADNIHVVDAWAIFANAQDRIAMGDYENGLEQYKNAYMEAERAEGEWVPREYRSSLVKAINDIDILLTGPYSADALSELQEAKDELIEALNKINHGLMQDSFVNVRNAVEHLLDADGFGAPALSIAVDLTEAIEKGVEMLIIETETHVGVEVNDIKQAWSKFKKGHEFADNDMYLQAIDKYDRAYTHALLAEDWIPIADAGPDQLSIEDEIVYFNASNSRDRDGIVLFYEWDFGDGCKDFGVFVNHAYKDAGVYNVTLLITDNEVLMDIGMVTVTVTNIVPSANIILDYVSRDESSPSNIVYEDDLVFFDAIYSDTPSDLPGLVFHWDFGDNTVGFGAHIKHVYSWPGVYTVILTITDEDGDVGTASTTITVNNVIPTASLTYSQIAFEDEVVYLSGYGFDSPSDVKTLIYTWDFGDGYSGSGKEVTHIYTNEGIYTVTLSVTDVHGDVDASMITISVINPPPLADAGWIQFGDEDSVMNFIGTGLDTPSDGSLLTYNWDYGDNSGASGITQTHDYAIAGTYTVTLTVTDDNGDIGVDRILVFVENVEPTADAGGDQTVNEDDVVSFDGSGSDTGSDVSFLTYSWDFGDGSMGSGMNPTHIYTQAGTYLVTLTVSDDDEALATDTMTVTVYNIVPTANAGSNQLVDEDELVFFTGSGTDTPTDESLLTYSWDFGDGGIGFGKNPTHSYTCDGTYTVKLTVTDDDEAAHFDTMIVEVDNVVPMAMAGPDLIVYAEPTNLYFRARALDTHSDLSTLTYEWDFDDGTTATGIFVSHMYMASGTYNLALTVIDNDGESHTDIAVITLMLDSDGDGLSDELEDELGTDKEFSDTDADGIDDYEEVYPGYDGYVTNATNPDTDGDEIEDWEEIYTGDDSYQTDPTNPDTDFDGLNDWEEIYEGEDGYFTDPTDPDSDDDGLLDGDEGYLTVFKSDERIKIKDGNSVVYTPVPLENVAVSAPYDLIEKVEARIGITHEKRGDLLLKIKKDSGSWFTLFDATDSDTELGLFTDFDLLQHFTETDFTTESTWTLNVGDVAKENKGFLEYFEIAITARLDPNNPDCDGDGLNDSEEVNLGDDGWLTDPWDDDTDGDDVSDGDEVLTDHDLTRSGTQGSNPTVKDTDRDGINDNVDNGPLTNTGVKVTILDIWVNNSADSLQWFAPEPFVLITVSDFSFPTINPSYPGDWAGNISVNGYSYSHFNNLNYHFTGDVPDDESNVDIILAGYENDGGNDQELDIVIGTGIKHTIDYEVGDIGKKITGTSTSVYEQKSHAAKVKYQVETVSLDRINTILLNGTGSDIYKNKDGDLRWIGESEFYVIYLKTNSDSSNSVFNSNTWYTILSPRSVFVNSYFNKTIDDGSISSASSGITGIEFSKQDGDADKAKRNVVQVLAGEDISPSDALEILKYLQFNNSAFTDRIAYYHVITEQLHTLGLPEDVIKSVPYKEIVNSEVGHKPKLSSGDKPWWKQAWDGIAGTVAAIIAYVAEGLVTLWNFFQDLWDALVEIGQALIGAIIDVLNKIKEALEAIVDLLLAIIKWIIDAVTSAFNKVIDAITAPFRDWMIRFANAINNLLSLGTTQEEIDKAFLAAIVCVGELTIVLTVITAIIYIVDIGMTLGMAFGISALVFALIQVLITIAFNAASEEAAGAILSILEDTVLPALGTLGAIGTVGGLILIFAPFVFPGLVNKISNLLSKFGMPWKLSKPLKQNPISKLHDARTAIAFGTASLFITFLSAWISTQSLDKPTQAILLLTFDIISLYLATRSFYDAYKGGFGSTLGKISLAFAGISLAASLTSFSLHLVVLP